ncbi:DUF2157 domain-containing protein [Neobacillus sp. YIM B06451]|uniref:DUF2157 domain-containing protein n=1 Tax=Neobacillus sp. YIM B06451 TaxID=3070994 RepID=UPI00292CF760|nr:DUF2157 domain-containing protein [Neobacillus sp. YIM B06451]
MKKIRKKQYEFLQKECSYLAEEGVLSDSQTTAILSMYEMAKRPSLIAVLLVIAAVSIGLGILSFVASNWLDMPDFLKCGMIVSFFLLVFYGGYRLEGTFPKLSWGLYILSTFVYGGGIFLIGQTFNFGGEASGAFLLWGLGIIPLAVYKRSTWLFSFSIILSIGGQFLGQLPGFFLPFLLSLGYLALNEKVIQSKKGHVLSLLFLLASLIPLFETFHAEEALILLAYFAIGILLIHLPYGAFRYEGKWVGFLSVGVSGIFLSFDSIWYGFFPDVGTIVFNVLYVLYLFYLLKTERILAALLMASLLLRFYFDLSFKFLPKSMFFVFAGVVILTVAFLLHRFKKGGNHHEEE